MKKLLAIILVVFLLFSLAACDEQSPAQNPSGSPSGNPSENPTQPGTEFTELVAVDNTECLIKITEIDPDNFWGYTLKVQLENKSSEKTYMFSVTNASINGVECDPLFATEVAAGKKANGEIRFLDTAFQGNEIGEYTDIELTFRVYDSDDWLADAVAEETVHVYPLGENKATRFERETKSTDVVIVDNAYVTVVVTGYEDGVLGYGAKLFLVNKTDKKIMFTVDDASVNGYMADPFYADSVSAGKCAFSTITWFDSVLEENGIVEIEEIEFVLRAYDAENWLADDFANENIVLNP